MRTLPSRLQTRYVVQPLRAAAEYARLPREARRVLILFDGVRSTKQVVQESGLPPDLTLQVLGRLTQLKVVAPILTPATELPPRDQESVREANLGPPTPAPGPASTAAQEPTFTADEDLFFASGIDHLLEIYERPSPANH